MPQYPIAGDATDHTRRSSGADPGRDSQPAADVTHNTGGGQSVRHAVTFPTC